MLVRRFPLAAPLIALVALACGGGADEVDPAAVDAAYVRDACLAYLAWEDLLRGNLEAVETPWSENTGEYEAVIVESAAAWLEGLRAATPPDDLAEHHADRVARLAEHHADRVARLADWLAAWREGRPPPDTADQPESPLEALDRLGEVFREVPECEGLPPPAWLLGDFQRGIALGMAQTGDEGE